MRRLLTVMVTVLALAGWAGKAQAADFEWRMATIDRGVDHQNRVRLYQFTKPRKLFRPHNAAHEALHVFQIKHDVLGMRLTRSWILGVRKLDGRQHATDDRF